MWASNSGRSSMTTDHGRDPPRLVRLILIKVPIYELCFK